MRLFKRIFLLASLLLCSSSWLLAAPPHLIAINQCIEQLLNSQEIIDTQANLDLDQTCPSVVLSYDQQLYTGLYSQDISQINSFTKLRDLAFNLSHSLNQTHQLKPLDNQQLASILAETHIANDQTDLSWWQRFKRWVSSFEKNNPDIDTQWITQFLNNLSIPEWLGQSIYIISLSIIVLMGLGMVIYEFRQQRGRKKRVQKIMQSFHSDFAKTALQQTLSHTEIQQLASHYQPPALLRLVVQQLTLQHRLPDNLSFTNHEFLAYLKKHHAVIAKPFNQISQAAESILYGQNTQTIQLEALHQATRQILAKPTEEAHS